METLQEMVRSLVGLVVVAAALDLALPRGQMRGYVRMVVGLMVVQTLLSPMLALVRQPLTAEQVAELPVAPAGGFPDPEELAARARRLGERLGAQAAGELQHRVTREAERAARQVPGVQGATAEVLLEQREQPGASPRVRQVTLRITPAGAAARKSSGGPGSSETGGSTVAPIAPVEPVRVGAGQRAGEAVGAAAEETTRKTAGETADSGERAALVAAVQERVAGALGLGAEQVAVRLLSDRPLGTGVGIWEEEQR